MALAGNAPLWRALQVRGLLEAKSGWLLAATLAGMLAAGLSRFSACWHGVLR